MNDKILFVIGLFFTLLTSQASAHIGIAHENVFALGDAPREYLEGKTAELGVQLPHDCSNEAGDRFATKHVKILFPNGMGTVEPGYITKNPVNSIKAKVTANWKKVKVMKGEVEPYENLGNLVVEDIRAVGWYGGYVDNDHYDNLYVKMSFPKFEPQSCASRLDVYVPSVQYCKGDYKIAWIGVEDSTVFQDDEKTRVTEDFAARFTVVRDLDENPLPNGCQEDYTIEAWPTTEEIDMYLPKMHGDHGGSPKEN